MVLGALIAVGAQAFSSTPTTTTGGLPPCGTIDENGLNCQGLKIDLTCYYFYSTTYEDSWWTTDTGGDCDCTTTFCCSEDDGVFENGECDTTLSGR